MSSCLSGAGRTYGFELEIVKSPSSTSPRTSHSSSPSSTISESSNSPIAISTRKPRTPRKRPNQTYNEAAALLSTAYPNIFSTKNLKNPCKFTKSHDSFLEDSSELLFPFRAFDASGFLLHQPVQEKPSFQMLPKVVNCCEKPCQSSVESEFPGKSPELCDGFEEDFDAESILDEEIEGGIDSIMGNLSVDNEMSDEATNPVCFNSYYGNGIPMGLGFGGKFEFGFGMRRGVRALRHVDEGDWWRFPTVDILEISPKFNKVSAEKKKKKVEKAQELRSWESPKGNSIPKSNSSLLLKLNYDDVLSAWSDRGSPFSRETEFPGNDTAVRFSPSARKSKSKKIWTLLGVGKPLFCYSPLTTFLL